MDNFNNNPYGQPTPNGEPIYNAPQEPLNQQNGDFAPPPQPQTDGFNPPPTQPYGGQQFNGYNQYAQPQPQQPEKKKKGVIIALIVAGVLLLGCCCCCGGIFASGSDSLSDFGNYDSFYY